MSEALTTTSLPNLLNKGKVRDIYDMGHLLLFVATDRISAFDVVLPTGIPERGVVLNEISRFWFERTQKIVPNHLIAMAYEADKINVHPPLPKEIARRAMLVKRATPIEVECIVRGYLAGSAWSEYRRHGTIGGEKAPAGLQESQRLEAPLFTPTTKAQEGHDEPITFTRMEEMVGAETAQELRRLSLALYDAGHAYAETKGVLIADTKFEFGTVDGEIILIDELLTPDSSRFWTADDYTVGRPQNPMDKQFVRDWLEKSDWNKEPPGPELPADIVQQTAKRYLDVYERLTGQPLPTE